ncbi:MAG: hypothetical protein AVDCRST_MAG04-1638, partial [uncultured Acetobacteraceae bacterium]
APPPPPTNPPSRHPAPRLHPAARPGPPPLHRPPVRPHPAPPLGADDRRGVGLPPPPPPRLRQRRHRPSHGRRPRPPGRHLPRGHAQAPGGGRRRPRALEGAAVRIRQARHRLPHLPPLGERGPVGAPAAPGLRQERRPHPAGGRPALPGVLRLPPRHQAAGAARHRPRPPPRPVLRPARAVAVAAGPGFVRNLHPRDPARAGARAGRAAPRPRRRLEAPLAPAAPRLAPFPPDAPLRRRPRPHHPRHGTGV